ncbi:hypothetical protein [Actinoplanes sp. G11-F43]|uniref:hypothetical protein n=1 Tax=Actinoplanes sp. G11-F43 TaxID=3424130 RepID=UPI003D334D83
MTSQVPDTISFSDTEFAITAVDGSGLFDPRAHGYHPAGFGSACWRGSICAYALRDGRLVLDSVLLGPPEDGRTPPVLFGVRPRHTRHWAGSGNGYAGLRAPVPFTGRLLGGAGPVSLGYLNMGFRPAWLFDRVIEFGLEAGRLITSRDRCAEAAALRSRLGTAGLGPAGAEDAGGWVDRTFSLDFGYSLPTPPTS